MYLRIVALNTCQLALKENSMARSAIIPFRGALKRQFLRLEAESLFPQ